MKTEHLLIGAVALAAGAFAYKKMTAKSDEPLTPEDEDDYVAEEWIVALPDGTSARMQTWQSATKGSFYGRWAQFAADGETLLASGGTPHRPGMDEVAEDLGDVFTEGEPTPIPTPARGGAARIRF